MTVLATSRKTPSKGKSRVTNGRSLFPGEVDGRGVRARRFRDIVEGMISDLGGLDALSEMQIDDVREAAMLRVYAEERQADVVSGQTINLTDHLAAINTRARIYRRLGYKKATPKAPSLDEYLASKSKSAA